MNINRSLGTRLMVVSLLGIIAGLALLIVTPSGKAIPAFSRKYQTSCTTCHNNYPELNDFGVAFKKRGFNCKRPDPKISVFDCINRWHIHRVSRGLSDER